MWTLTPTLMTAALTTFLTSADLSTATISPAELERFHYGVWYDRVRFACNYHRGRLDIIWSRRSESAEAECVVSDKVRLYFNGYKRGDKTVGKSLSPRG